MQYILLLILIALTIFSYIAGQRDIGSPFFISCVVFLICLTFGLFFYSKWDIEFAAITVFVVTIALISFGLGQFFSNKLLKKKKKFFIQKEIKIRKLKTLIIFVCGTLFALINFLGKIRLAQELGYEGNLLESLRKIELQGTANNATNYIMFFMSYLFIGIGYVYTFIIINNFIINNKRFFRKNSINFLPILPFVINLVLTAARFYLFLYFFLVFFCYLIILRINNKNKKIKVKQLLGVLIFSCAGIIFFFVYMGFLRSGSTNWIESFAIYLSSSLAALNNYLKDGIQYSQEFGQETLFGLRYILSKLGLKLEQFKIHQPFINFNSSYSTNVYTAIKPYLCDFGYVGMIIIQFFMGFIYSFFYGKIKNRGKIDFTIILYAYLAFPLVYQIFTPEFLGSFLSLAQIMTVISILIAYKIIVPRRIYERDNISGWERNKAVSADDGNEQATSSGL